MKRYTVCLCILATSAVLLHADDDPAKVPVPKPPKAEKPPTMEEVLARNKELVPSLIVGLKDSNSEVRLTSAYILVNIGKPAIDPLAETLKNQDRDMRANAAYVLSQFGKTAEGALPALTAALKDEDAEVRRRSAYAISRILEDVFTPPPQPPTAPPVPPPPPPPDGGPQQAGYTPAYAPRFIKDALVSPKPARPFSDPGLLLPDQRSGRN